MELLGAESRVPCRLKSWQHARDLLEADAVGPFVRSGVRRHFDAAAKHYAGNDLSNIAHAIVVGGAADVEDLVEHELFRRLERGNECAGYVLNGCDRAPGRSIRLEVDASAGDREGCQIVENDVKAHARRDAVSAR